MPVTLTSISPLSGPPGTAITAAGSGFDAACRLACPTLQPTTLNRDGTLTATIPANLEGPGGGTMPVGVYAIGCDGSTSAVILFTVEFPPGLLQGWTTIDAVCGMVPGFQRGGQISDDRITEWIESAGQALAAIMAKRGLPLDPTAWPPAPTGCMTTPAGLLEMINRLGAAADLAGAVGSLWGAREWDVAKTLRQQYDDEMLTLREGEYDRVFLAAAATVEPRPQLAAFGECHPAFRKDKVF